MSWSISIGATDVADFKDAANEKAYEKADEIRGYKEFNAPDESIEQMRAAVDAAIAVVSTGAVGARVAASISGHANEGHEPKIGWADDQVSISLYHRRPNAD